MAAIEWMTAAAKDGDQSQDGKEREHGEVIVVWLW